MRMKLGEFLKEVGDGEAVLVEYSPLSHPELTFYSIVSWAKDTGRPVLIVDILDTLHVFKEQLRFMGYDTSFVDELPVVKEEGRVEEGRILGRTKVVEDLNIHLVSYGRIVKPFFDEVGDREVVVIVLGASKFLIPIQENPWLLERYFEKVVRAAMAKKGRISILFANVDLLNKYALQSWEESATRILRINKAGNVLHVKKSPRFSEIGMGVEV